MFWLRREPAHHRALRAAVQRGAIPEGFMIEQQDGDYYAPDTGAATGRRFVIRVASDRHADGARGRNATS